MKQLSVTLWKNDSKWMLDKLKLIVDQSRMLLAAVKF